MSQYVTIGQLLDNWGQVLNLEDRVNGVKS